MKTNFIILFITLVTTFTVTAQTTKFKDSGSVNNQFDYLIEKSNRYQDYKVVKLTWLKKLKNNVADSISVSKKELSASYKSINSQKQRIDSLKLALNTSKNSITNISDQIESISFMGIQFKKDTFKVIMFSIIGILALLLIIFITKFKKSNSVTTETKLSLRELDEEFETHRKVALEREQKVRRQLQDELNKQKKDK